MYVLAVVSGLIILSCISIYAAVILGKRTDDMITGTDPDECAGPRTVWFPERVLGRRAKRPSGVH